jgi:arylsulfatase A-like enzyme
MKARAVAVALVAAGCVNGGGPPSPSPSAGATVAAGNPLNVLLITIDTLRADHLGAYGYRRRTSPRMDALAASGALFERAYTFWPKTRGSFVMMMTGRLPAVNGYGKSHPILVDFNPTLASVLKGAGYETAALVDNPNVAARYGYAKGFDRYRETWEEPALDGEVARTRAITDEAVDFLRAKRTAPFFLWLHYVNPHAPYTPPPPFDVQFLDAAARRGRRLPVVAEFRGGIPRQWAVEGQDRLGYYVAQYDGEIALADREVGKVLDALAGSPHAAKTMVVLTSDHGESLGEHDYYFDHGQDVHEPSMAVPLLLSVPGAPAGVRSGALASTLDLVPTVLDAVKVSYPPDLAGRSLLREAAGEAGPGPARLFGGNERNHAATWDARFRLIAVPGEDGSVKLALYDRVSDPGEARDVSRARPEALREARRALELFQERSDRAWARTRPLLEGKAGEAPMSREACERLRALGYVSHCP